MLCVLCVSVARAPPPTCQQRQCFVREIRYLLDWISFATGRHLKFRGDNSLSDSCGETRKERQVLDMEGSSARRCECSAAGQRRGRGARATLVIPSNPRGRHAQCDARETAPPASETSPLNRSQKISASVPLAVLRHRRQAPTAGIAPPPPAPSILPNPRSPRAPALRARTAASAGDSVCIPAPAYLPSQIHR